MLLKLLIYGYLNQIRSSRGLERETKRNLEVIWMTDQARPDHWTINEIRKVNRRAFKQVLLEDCNDPVESDSGSIFRFFAGRPCRRVA